MPAVGCPPDEALEHVRRDSFDADARAATRISTRLIIERTSTETATGGG